MRFLSSKRIKWLAVRAGPLVPVFFAALLFATGAPLPRAVEGVGDMVAAPLFAVRDNLGAAVVTLYGSLETKDALLYENERLQTELTTLRRENFMADVLARENERLRTLLGQVPEERAWVPAAVIHSAAYAPFGSFVIDVGEQDGVREGMLVRTPQGAAVGAVVSVREQSAVVTAFSAAGMQTDAYLTGAASTPIVLLGAGGDTMRFQLSRAAEVTLGDLAVLPGLAAVPLGRVVRIDATEEDAYREVYVEPATSSMSLREVVVDTTHLWRIAPNAFVAPLVPPAATTTASTGTTTPYAAQP